MMLIYANTINTLHTLQFFSLILSLRLLIIFIHYLSFFLFLDLQYMNIEESFSIIPNRCVHLLIFVLCPTRNHVLPTVSNLSENLRPTITTLYFPLMPIHFRKTRPQCTCFLFCQLFVCTGGQVLIYLNYYSIALAQHASTFLLEPKHTALSMAQNLPRANHPLSPQGSSIFSISDTCLERKKIELLLGCYHSLEKKLMGNCLHYEYYTCNFKQLLLILFL